MIRCDICGKPIVEGMTNDCGDMYVCEGER